MSCTPSNFHIINTIVLSKLENIKLQTYFIKQLFHYLQPYSLNSVIIRNPRLKTRQKWKNYKRNTIFYSMISRIILFESASKTAPESFTFIVYYISKVNLILELFSRSSFFACIDYGSVTTRNIGVSILKT